MELRWVVKNFIQLLKGESVLCVRGLEAGSKK